MKRRHRFSGLSWHLGIILVQVKHYKYLGKNLACHSSRTFDSRTTMCDPDPPSHIQKCHGMKKNQESPGSARFDAGHPCGSFQLQSLLGPMIHAIIWIELGPFTGKKTIFTMQKTIVFMAKTHCFPNKTGALLQDWWRSPAPHWAARLYGPALSRRTKFPVGISVKHMEAITEHFSRLYFWWWLIIFDVIVNGKSWWRNVLDPIPISPHFWDLLKIPIHIYIYI